MRMWQPKGFRLPQCFYLPPHPPISPLFVSPFNGHWNLFGHHFMSQPSLGLTIKAKAWKGVGRECNPRITFTLLGVQESVGEWAYTLPTGLPLWELETLWIPKFSKNNLKGQNTLNWKLPYTIGKLLRHICLKWAHMIYLSPYNTSYGRKKGSKSKYQFDYPPLKVRNRPKLHVCRWRATYRWKPFDEGYNIVWDHTSIEGFHKKLWASKVKGVLISKKLGLLTWESQKKWH
jgi:hypothetical protein